MQRAGRGDGGADRGAALVEMAFTLVLLVMLLVGVVTSAVAYARGNSIQNATREASRFAATLPGDGASLGWFQEVRDLAQAAASGDLDSGVPNLSICVAFVTEEDAATRVDNDGVIENGFCFNDGRNGNQEARVQVVTQRDTTINAIIFSTDVTLGAEAAARYER